jgi:hypothetical protein
MHSLFLFTCVLLQICHVLSLAAESYPTSTDPVMQVIAEARRLGPGANDRTHDEKEAFWSQAKSLRSLSKPKPARIDFTGVHERLYSVSPGKKRGSIRQVFRDSSTLVNSVRLGPLGVSVTAMVKPIDDWTSEIRFQRMTYKLFGIPLYCKRVDSAAPAGTWKYLSVGEFVDNDGKRKLLRVMETPSLFLLTGDLE